MSFVNRVANIQYIPKRPYLLVCFKSVNCQTDLVTNFIFSTSLPKKNRLIGQTLVDVKQMQIGNSLLILISSFECKEWCSVLKSKCTIIHGHLHLTGTVFSKLCNWQKPYAPPGPPSPPSQYGSQNTTKHWKPMIAIFSEKNANKQQLPELTFPMSKRAVWP